MFEEGSNFFYGEYRSKKPDTKGVVPKDVNIERPAVPEDITPETISESFQPSVTEKELYNNDISDEEILKQMSAENENNGFNAIAKIKGFFYRPRTYRQIKETAKNLFLKPYNEASEYFDKLDKVCSGELDAELQKYYDKAYALGNTVRRGQIQRTFNMSI